MNVLAVSITDHGRAVARRLPFAAVHGGLGATVRERWADVDGFVLIAAVGVAVRAVAPLLADKHTDPAVVCVDDAGRWVVPVTGGHAGGANHLARTVADLLGATAVITTATDGRGVPGLDTLPGFVARGDIAGVTRALLDGEPVALRSELPGWPMPIDVPAVSADLPTAAAQVIVTDRRAAAEPGVVALHPPSLVVGVGTSADAPPDRVRALVEEVLADEGLAPESVAEVATIERRRGEPAITALGFPVAVQSAEALAAVAVPTPSDVVAAAVGTPSVAEAAALLAAGPDAELVVAKRKNDVATVAVARRVAARGSVILVGLGPGHAMHRTPAADRAVRTADVVVGYGPYVEQAAALLSPRTEVLALPVGAEVERANLALEHASRGRRVAVVCSGDAGIYAMASIVAEIAPAAAPGVEVSVVPGVSAGLAAAAVLGAPLGHDHVLISLSDLLTPWEVIERRVEAAGAGDFVTVFYNPRSRVRDWQLPAALQILGRHRAPGTPVGIVTAAGRAGEAAQITTLGGIDVTTIGMTTCVIVGSSTTTVIGGRMVTPRGYKR